MDIITKKTLIGDVAKRWENQYKGRMWSNDHDKMTKLSALKKLPKSATDEDVKNIIGNYSWTRNFCDECKKESDILVVIGEKPDIESSTAHVCPECLKDAINLVNDHKKDK